MGLKTQEPVIIRSGIKMLSAKPIWPRILPLPDVWLLSRGDTASGNASAMFLMKNQRNRT